MYELPGARRHERRPLYYGFVMSRTRSSSGASSRPARVVFVCFVALIGSLTRVSASLTGGAPTAAATGPFDASAWAPWWQATSALTSFNSHYGEFGELSPFFFSATGAETIVTNPNLGSGQISAYKSAASAAGKPLVPTIVDATAAHVMAGILANPDTRAKHAARIVKFVVDGGYAGVDLDYEQFAFADGSASWASTKPNWAAFIQQVSGLLHGVGKTLAVSVPPIYNSGTSSGSGYWVYDYATLGAYVDRVRVMTYAYSTSSPGPIAPFNWVDSSMNAALALVPGDRLVMGIPLYGTDWVTNIQGSCPASIPSGMTLTRKSYRTSEFPALAQKKGVVPEWNSTYRERTFTYTDSIGGLDTNGSFVRCNVSHTVFYVDPDGVYDRVARAKQMGLAGTALWSLGNDDQFTWNAIDAAMLVNANPGYAQLTPNVVAPPGPPITSALPARYVDTRVGMKTLDGLYAGIGARSAGSTLLVQIAGRGAVPLGTQSVVLNVTVLGEGQGYVTVYPCGSPPTTSNLNVRIGQTISNTVITELNAAGRVCIYNQAQLQLVVDVFNVLPVGSFDPVPTPARLLDTRVGEPTVDGLYSSGGAMAADTVVEIPVAGRAGMGADAVTAVLNVTVVGSSISGYLTVWPCEDPRPATSNVNFVPGVIVANAVVTGLSPAGSICLYSSGTAHVVVDTFGELTEPDYTRLVQPARLLDTRVGYPTFDAQFAGGGLRPGNTELSLSIAARAGLPSDVRLVVLNVTVVGPAGSGYVTVYPCGASRPNVSNVNFAAGQILPNLAVATVSAQGTICLYTSVPTHLVVDAFGWLEP